MINTIIACAFFFLIGLVLGYIFGVGPDEPYEDIVHHQERKDKKREGYYQGPMYTVKNSEVTKPKVHVINPKSPAQVEFERQNKKPDIMKPE